MLAIKGLMAKPVLAPAPALESLNCQIWTLFEFLTDKNSVSDLSKLLLVKIWGSKYKFWEKVDKNFSYFLPALSRGSFVAT